MDFKDYYSTLGVAKTATDKELKQAYRKLARKYHPDVNPGDAAKEAKFKELTEAYEVLGDPEKRRKYDELGANWRAYENMPPPGAGGSPFGGFGGGSRGFGGGGGGVHTMSEEEMREVFGGGGGFSDFFQAFFGGEFDNARSTHGGGGARSRARKGRDIEQEIELSLDDVYGGVTRRLQFRL